MARKGILLNEEGELDIKNKELVVGDSVMQEVSIILQMNQGESKFDPLLGANLVNLIKTNTSRFDLENRVKTHLALDGKDYEQIKHLITTHIKK